jgi:hypothetical protein
MTNWNTQQVSVLMSLMPNLDSEEPGWRVFVTYRKTNDAGSNNKLQRTRGSASESADGSSRKDKLPSLYGIPAARR